jgi:hypothetical protein
MELVAKGLVSPEHVKGVASEAAEPPRAAAQGGAR